MIPFTDEINKICYCYCMKSLVRNGIEHSKINNLILHVCLTAKIQHIDFGSLDWAPAKNWKLLFVLHDISQVFLTSLYIYSFPSCSKILFRTMATFYIVAFGNFLRFI